MGGGDCWCCMSCNWDKVGEAGCITDATETAALDGSECTRDSSCWVAAFWSCAFCAAATAAVVVGISIWGESDVASLITVSTELCSPNKDLKSGPSSTDAGASMPIVSVI